MRIYFLLIVFMYATFSSSVGFSAEDPWKGGAKRVERYFKSGRCEDTWHLIWEGAKAGSLEARSLLALYIIHGGLYPAGYINLIVGDAKDPSKADNLLKSIIAHGAASGNKSLVSAAMENPNDYPKMAGKIDIINNCFRSEIDKNVCVNLAVRAGTIMSFKGVQNALESDPVYKERTAVCPSAVKRPKFPDN